MTQRRGFALLCALLAACAGAVFFAISIDHEVYAPGAGDVSLHTLIHVRHIVPRHFRHDVTQSFILRKAYSIVAFAIVGLLAAPAIPPKRRVLTDALAVGLFSTMIEIGQKVTGTHESLRSNAFDVACGALGGLIGALVWNLATRAARRASGR